jgi:hypothetical protein
MPGLLRGVARTAVVAGTATAVSNRVSRRQSGRWAQQEPQAQQPAQSEPAAQPVQDPAGHTIEQLKELAALRDKGILTDAEFETQKQRILGS